MSPFDPGDRDGDPAPDPQPEAPTKRMLSWARNSALYRLSRRMMTEHELAAAIIRKARTKFEGLSEEHARVLADVAVAFGRDMGALDDRTYAASRLRSATASGKSARMIARKLSEKGVDREIITETLDGADDPRAALIFARKRAFGPFRRVEGDQQRLSKELASLARNGFAFDLARRVLDMSRDEAEAELLDGRPAELGS